MEVSISDPTQNSSYDSKSVKTDAKVNAKCHTLQNDLRPETRENRCDGEEGKDRILSAKIALFGSQNEYSQPRVNRTSDDPARSHQKKRKKYQK